jgi:hypothetical protein
LNPPAVVAAVVMRVQRQKRPQMVARVVAVDSVVPRLVRDHKGRGELEIHLW